MPREARHLARDAWKMKLETQRCTYKPREYILRSSTVYDTLDDYLDDNYSDQDSIFGEVAEEHSNRQFIGTEDDPPSQPSPYQIHPSSPWSCYPQLQPYERIIPGQVYRLPEVQTFLAVQPTIQSSPSLSGQAVANSNSIGETPQVQRFGVVRRLQDYFRRSLGIFRRT